MMLHRDPKQQSERIKELEAWRDSWVKCPEGAVAQRIKELEAELLSAHCQAEHNGQELAALRQRIDDAPVVAWLHTQSNGCSSLTRTPPSAFDPQDLADAEVSIYALISKEDLK